MTPTSGSTQSRAQMEDILAVLGPERVAIIGGLMLLALAVTLLACVPTAYVQRITGFFRRLLG